MLFFSCIHEVWGLKQAKGCGSCVSGHSLYTDVQGTEAGGEAGGQQGTGRRLASWGRSGEVRFQPPGNRSSCGRMPGVGWTADPSCASVPSLSPTTPFSFQSGFHKVRLSPRLALQWLPLLSVLSPGSLVGPAGQVPPPILPAPDPANMPGF